jgi:hypothetical protein
MWASLADKKLLENSRKWFIILLNYWEISTSPEELLQYTLGNPP